MTTITYCANGCTRRHGDDWHPVTTEAPSLICRHCDDRLHQWLTAIPDTYALLPAFIEHGSTDPDPEHRTGSSQTPPPPMRLDVIDLLDVRRGRKWNGLAPADDRRGTAGTLKIWLDILIEDRPLTRVNPITTIVGACNLLDRHRLWITEQDWVTDFYEDMRKLHRSLSDAIGDYRRPSVGPCPADNAEERCGGRLFANEVGGVRCARCKRVWDAEHLRLLGLVQTQTEESA